MKWKRITPILAGFCVVVGIVGSGPVCAQVFPYAAPKAPEFDSNGEVVLHQSGDETAPPSISENQSAPAQESPVQPAVAHTRYGVPMAPEVIPRRGPSRRQRGPSRRQRARIGTPQTQAAMAPRQAAPPQNYSQPYGPSPSAPPNQVQGPNQDPAVPDCSSYPMMLARAANRHELQSIARHFLTCLLESGWTMDSARKHVISTIETVKAMRF